MKKKKEKLIASVARVDNDDNGDDDPCANENKNKKLNAA